MNPLLGQTVPLVPPLYQSSVYTLPDLDALDAVYAGEPGFIYARDGHPNARMLGEQIACLESASWAVVGGSGMSVIAATLLALVSRGDRILASRCLYGRTNQLLTQELPRFGVETELVDCTDLAAVAGALEIPAKLMVVETMSNPLLRVCDVDELASLCRRRGCLTVVDNTFATPMLCRPLERGADLVVESVTKLLGGHGDVTLGAVCGRTLPVEPFAQAISIWGLMGSPFECWLASRGLATLALRVERGSSNAAALAEWLPAQPGVGRVIYPGRTDHPDHATAQRQFTGGFGTMLCFELAGGRDAVNRFLRAAPDVPFSPSLGDVRTTCSYPAATSHRYLPPAERERQGIGPGLLRLSVGIEPLEQIQRAICRGLSAAAS